MSGCEAALGAGEAGAERRAFLKGSALAAAGALAAAPPARSAPPDDEPIRDFLRKAAVPRESIDRFLDPKARVWARFEPEYGYLNRSAFLRDGVDGAYSLYRFEPGGQRKQLNFPDQPCRINTYGDSFTQGHQVSDGETWQEVLAAHFCEPIRNFGVGGFGVYQAYRRLLRTESGDLAAPWLIFNIYGDDHLRSVNAWRWLTFRPEFRRSMEGVMFHANPWAHARLDLSTGALVERPNPCPTPGSLYQLCDPESIVDLFAKDLVVRMLVAMEPEGKIDPGPLESWGPALGLRGLDWSTPAAIRASAERLYHAYAVRASIRIFEKLVEHLQRAQKRLLVLLSYPQGSVWHACQGSPREAPGNVDWHPRELREALARLGIGVVDSLVAHVKEFRGFRLSAKDYVARYYIGHYNPRGNHFFAYAVKDPIRDWLDPKPPAYRGDDESLIRFKGYLPG